MNMPVAATRRLMRADQLCLLLAAVACLSLPALCGFAQDSPGDSSGRRLALDTEAVSPRCFIAAHGRRALIDGYAAKGLEAWAYPFQILSSYRIAFHSPGASASIDGEKILSRVSYEPDSVTRVYLGSDFIVREKLFVPLNLPGAIISYSVQSSHPVEIEVHAAPVLNLMWPAALGGQTVAWNPSLSAFVLSEPSHGFTATVGSREIVAHDEPNNNTTHTAGEPGIGFTMHPGASGVARVILALNPPHTPDPGALYRRLIHEDASLQAEFAAHLDQLQSLVLRVETPDNRVNRAIAWAEIAIDQAWVCNPDLGCGYVAGYGPSRGERRPQYDWFFAGDGLVAAGASRSDGDRAQAREELEFILRYQNTGSGMIWHELSQSAGYLDWAGKYPYMFVHVDITYQFLAAAASYVNATGDIAFLREHWPAIEAAYRYCRSLIDPATALPRIPAGKEGGDEQDRMSDDLGLSTSWVAASSAFAQMAALTGHSALADEAARASQRASASVSSRYWDAGQSFWISGHLESGKQMTERRSGPDQAIVLHLFNPKQEALLLDQLASSAFQTDWGLRGVGSGSASFNPESYARGSVWPVSTAALAETFWSEHRPVTALSLWRTLIPLAALDSLGHIPEVMTGDYYRPQAESVPEQTWSSAGFLEATIHGLLGLQTNPIANHLIFAPRLPAAWKDLTVAHIRLSGAPISLRLHRTLGEMTLEIDNWGGPFKLEFTPELPLGAKLLNVDYNHRLIASTVRNYPQQTDVAVSLNAPHGKSELRLDFEGGVSVTADNPEPLLGDASAGIRVVDVHLERNALIIAADVPANRASRLHLESSWNFRKADGATLQPINAGITELIFSATPGAASSYRRAKAIIEIKP